MPQRLATLGIVPASGALNLRSMDPDHSGDLLALWLAVAEVARGNPAGIRPPVAPLFGMRPSVLRLMPLSGSCAPVAQGQMAGTLGMAWLGPCFLSLRHRRRGP